MNPSGLRELAICYQQACYPRTCRLAHPASHAQVRLTGGAATHPQAARPAAGGSQPERPSTAKAGGSLADWDALVAPAVGEFLNAAQPLGEEVQGLCLPCCVWGWL